MRILQDRDRELKSLDTKLRRQEYLTKKQTRVSESTMRKLKTAESAANESALRVMQLESQIMNQKKQTRSQLLRTYREDVQRIKQTNCDLEKSVEKL